MDFKTLFFLLAGLIYSSFCFSDFRDPTRPNCSSQSTTSTLCKNGSLQLSSILISGNYKLATINGRSAKEGDVILSSIKVLSIAKNSVLIQDQNKEQRKLVLYDISTVDD